MYDVLVVGAGVTGAVHAERLASQGRKVLVIDRRDHIGGNCYDYAEKGIMIHKYGPHIFHTNNEAVWNYLSGFTDWHLYMHRVLACVDGIFIPIPFNLNSLYMVFPPKMAEKLETKLLDTYGYGKKIPIALLIENADRDLKFLADFIYEKIFKYYTLKQWGIGLDELDPSVGMRVPIHISRDDRYFTDKYQAIPENGYTEMVKNILSHSNITIKLNTDFKDVKETVKYNKLIYTGPIDDYFNYKYGKLPYRSLRFKQREFDRPYYQQTSQVNYPNNYEFTRITEFKHFLNTQSPYTITVEEYPEVYIQGRNDIFYPVETPESIENYKQYRLEITDTLFAGRLGDFKYYNMDQAVGIALQLYPMED